MRRRCGEPTRRDLLAGLGAGLALLPFTRPAAAAREVPLGYQPGDTALLSRATAEGLAHGIRQYEAIAAAGGWPRLDGGRLSPAQDDPRVADLQRLLIMTGDLPRDQRLGTVYTPSVREGVMRYQARHGLPTTGTVSGITQAHMNVSTADRLRQLKVNLGRLNDALGRAGNAHAHVCVNTASFELQAVSGGRVELASRVITGKRETPSPVVSATVRAVDLLPYWHVPESVARAALVPQAQKDVSYFYKNRIRVFSAYGGAEVDPASVNWYAPDALRYTFRQDPGPQNALGVVRLDMPNPHIVYMHDTPFKNLFDYPERAISAGCCRVQAIFELAAWITGGQDGWTADGIVAATDAGQRGTIKLARPVPVHFVYLTAWAQDGQVQFRNDLYNRDDTAAVPRSGEPAGLAPFSGLAP
ncbi:MAG: L,D-transpeptidase family protein [Hyphomicrobiaceae bacterium]|nr:L,D-transpeptidase family protein [Hyphomicrobiaceae bacterium]